MPSTESETTPLVHQAADDSGILCPATQAGDLAFITFARKCNEAVRDTATESQAAITRLTEGFVAKWRMHDTRFLQCQPNAMYGSYLLYVNREQTLNIVLDVFMPGQAAFIHNHLCWCVFTCLEGLERERLYHVDPELSAPPNETEDRICPIGQVRQLAAERHLFHQVECASDRPTISLHIYGADIGRLERDTWSPETGTYTTFKSGYSNDLVGLPPYYVAG